MKRILLFSFLIPCITLLAQKSESFAVKTLQDSLSYQLTIFPQEKIHLHTDRDRYIPGEKIWFKIYVTDAQTHQSQTYSQYVYVELMNDSDTLISRVMIRLGEDMMYYGYLFISDPIPAGYYTLRAYTRFMENLGDDYYFKKIIRIGNLPDEVDKRKNVQKKQNVEDYDVSFYPEGGNLLDQTFCKVAFKALDKDGHSIFVSGELTDEADNVILTQKTLYAGMGLFSFIPVKGKKYFFKTKNNNGLAKKFTLPEVRDTYSICTVLNNDNHLVTLSKSADCPEIPLYLIVQTRGFILYSAPWNPANTYISFPKDQLPSGVIHFILLDTDKQPISERLAFNLTDDQADAVFSTDQTVYAKREKVTSKIYIEDKDQNRPSGNLSIAVVDDSDMGVDTLTTIQSTLLLSSELKGYIETPAYYLQDHDEAKMALDMLMMTHGWRRYDIPESLKGKYAYPEKTIEKAKEITGDVKNLLLNRPVVDATVSILSSDQSVCILQTDSAGHFGLYDFEYPDSTEFFVHAKNPKGNERVELFLNGESFPEPKHAPNDFSRFSEEAATRYEEAFLKKSAQRMKYDEDIRIINLPELVITDENKTTKDDPRSRFWANASSDYTMNRKQIEMYRASRVIDLIRMIPGVMMNGDNISIRGGGLLPVQGSNANVNSMGMFTAKTNTNEKRQTNNNTNMFTAESMVESQTNVESESSVASQRRGPLIVIDGMVLDGDVTALDYVMVDDLESIDVFKGSSTSLFGGQGGYGVISLTSRMGDFSGEPKQVKFNYMVYRPIGFQKPVEFYAPIYDTPAAKNLSSPDYRTTIFWKPDVVVEADGKATFEFYTSDFATTYSVVIEGITENGEIVRQIEKITVE